MRSGPRNPELCQKARDLRQAGAPFKKIAASLGISPASALAWTGDIELTYEQHEHNRRRTQSPEARAARAAAWAAKARARRAEFQEQGRRRAREGNPLHQAGCMLYLAEGAKGRNRAKFANSDPGMTLLFRRFLTDALGVDRGEILDLLYLPGDAVRKHTLNHLPTSSSGRAKTRLPYGVCFLIVDRTWVVQHIYGAIQEYAGFEDPRWLD